MYLTDQSWHPNLAGVAFEVRQESVSTVSLNKGGHTTGSDWFDRREELT